MKSWASTLVSIFLVASAATALEQKTQTDPKLIVRDFYQLREKTLDQRGRPQDVEQLLAMFTANATYEHPQANVTMTLQQAKQGIIAHLNEGKNATITIKHISVGRNFAVAEVSLEYTVPGQAGKDELIKRNGLSLFQLEDGKIARVAEY